MITSSLEPSSQDITNEWSFCFTAIWRQDAQMTGTHNDPGAWSNGMGVTLD